MSEKREYHKWIERQIRQNIQKALNQKEPSVLTDNKGEIIVEFDVGKLARIEEETLIFDFGETGLKTRGNLVGLGYILHNPTIFGCPSVQNFLESWNWLTEKTGIDPEALTMALEACSLSLLMLTGADMGANVHIFSLIFDLYKLDSLGVDTSSKTAEFGKQIRGHLREFERLIHKRPWIALLKIDRLTEYLSNVSSECRLARLAKDYGFTVKLGVDPDLFINGKKVEVKRRVSFDKYASLSNPIEEGLKRNPDIIAIEVHSLERRNIEGFNATWLGRSDLKSSFNSALSFRGKNKCILLFLGTIEGLEGRVILLKN